MILKKPWVAVAANFIAATVNGSCVRRLNLSAEHLLRSQTDDQGARSRTDAVAGQNRGESEIAAVSEVLHAASIEEFLRGSDFLESDAEVGNLMQHLFDESSAV